MISRRKKMKKNAVVPIALAALILLGASGGKKDGSVTHTETVHGYNGDMVVEVDITGKKTIDAIRIVSDHESSPVKKRAFPIIISRILKAQTPQVDSVSAASFSSYSIKSAVAAALKKAGTDVGPVAFKSGDTGKRKDLPAVHKKILIVGSGPAGEAAAISAVESGVAAKDILIIEKEGITGGNGKFDMVLFYHAASLAQKKIGREDSAAKLLETRKKTAWDSEARLAAETNMTVKMDDWYRKMGIDLNYVFEYRDHMAESNAYAGEEILDGLEKRIASLGIETRTETAAYDFIMKGNRLAGMKVKHKNEYYDITADAVIIATGGFCQNPALLEKYTPAGTAKLRSSNQIGATGDMVPLFEKHGFQLGHMDKTVVFGFMISRGRELTGERVAPQKYDYILVNKNGERFTNELVAYGLARGLDIFKQEGKNCWMIFDQGMVDFSFRIGDHIKKGLGVKADTMEALAEKIGVNKGNFVKTVNDYNRAAAGEIEDALRKKQPSRPFNAAGPYYALNIESAIHMTKGGVVCNENAQCLDAGGAVIPGAYAAGEVTDTSANFSAALIFGRIAGAQAAKDIL